MDKRDYTEEIWRDIRGFEGSYQVSDHGRVKRLKGRYCKKERILKLQDKQGYKRVELCNGYQRKKAVHRLVAIAFIPNPEAKTEVNHIDFNKSNNHVSNLEWVTSEENILHSESGDKSPSPTPIDMYSLDGEYIRPFRSIGDAAKFINTERSNIKRALDNDNRSSGGYRWKRKGGPGQSL